jgi:hypothetical protein
MDALDQFWRRSPFHDMVVETVSALNRRVLIRLKEYTLIATGVTAADGLTQCELPAVWLSERIQPKSRGYLFEVETEGGTFSIAGSDVRLIRNNDLAILIPPIDA